MSRSKPDWSRPLAKPIDVGRGRRKLRTLECVRAYVLARPPRYTAWQPLAAALLEAANGGDIKVVNEWFRFGRIFDRGP